MKYVELTCMKINVYGAGQGEAYENGSSGDTSDDMFGNIQSTRSSERPTLGKTSPNMHQDKDYSSHGLWSNSSRLTISNLLYFHVTSILLHFHICLQSLKSC